MPRSSQTMAAIVRDEYGPDPEDALRSWSLRCR